MSFHDTEGLGSVHIPYNWEYANAAARVAATGFVAGDVGKFARQLDDNSIWMLLDDSPVTWVAIGGGTSGVLPHKDTHVSGGTDAFASGDLLEAAVRRLRESSGPTTLGIGAIASGQILSRSGSDIIGVGFPAFGQNAASAASAAESTTTSAAWQTKLTLTTASLPDGTYRVGWYAEMRSSSTTSDFLMRVERDGTEVLALLNQEAQDASSYHMLSGFAHVTLVAGVHTFDIEYTNESPGTTAYIRNARIEFWRVS